MRTVADRGFDALSHRGKQAEAFAGELVRPGVRTLADRGFHALSHGGKRAEAFTAELTWQGVAA